MKTKKDNKVRIILLGLIVIAPIIVLSYVYQSVKITELSYQIIQLKDQINNLDIKNKELGLDNIKLQTNKSVEEAASDKLGMTYGNQDRVVVVHEKYMPADTSDTSDKMKINIFIQSLYQRISNQAANFNLKDFLSKFMGSSAKS